MSDDERVKYTAAPFYIIAGLFSCMVNVLLLVSPLYMLQVYDRVLTSGSVETLVLISLAAVGLLSAYGFAEAARRKSLSLISDFVQRKYGPAIFDAGLAGNGPSMSLPKRLTDLSTVQAYYQNGLPLPWFDLPFTPLFILAMFLVHPMIGWIGVIGGLILIAVTVVTEVVVRPSVKVAQAAELDAQTYADALSRNPSIINSLGLKSVLQSRWFAKKAQATHLTVKGTATTSFVSAQARGFRQVLQICALGLGAWLVLDLKISAGAIIAGSILMGRALSPIDQALGAWRQMVRARQAWSGLREAHKDAEDREEKVTPLPRPTPLLEARSLKVSAPGAEQALLPAFNLNIAGGSVVLVLGNSGSGKTSLLQTLMAAWQPFDGTVHLGGRSLHSWPAEDRGQYVGYLPQAVELLPGTVAENICRFSDASPEAIMDAARKVGMHDTILRLPEGYDTTIGAGSVHLSQGQRRGIGIARAFFGDPVVICLDEPSAHLDELGYGSLERSLSQAKQDGTAIILATHDTRFLSIADQVILLAGGTIKMVSAKDYQSAVSTRLKEVNLVEGRKL